ncbi:MAG: ribonuclease HII [Bacteroidetes bacterium]|nr:ribonuclease HII [Bacteroidota bacterium]
MNPDASLELFPPEDWQGLKGRPGLDIERRLWNRGITRIAGVDEAGRGCLAGPVVAAAVVFPHNRLIEDVRDSKALSRAERDRLADMIRQQATAVGIGSCTAAEIDKLNILWAAMEAMRRAVCSLSKEPDFVLIDGNTHFPNPEWPVRTVVKGDAISHTIAAASIVAKTVRDRLMAGLHEEFPMYGWASNVGYPTADHYRALVKHGPSPYHRRSFRLS